MIGVLGQLCAGPRLMPLPGFLHDPGAVRQRCVTHVMTKSVSMMR